MAEYISVSEALKLSPFKGGQEGSVSIYLKRGYTV